MKIFLFFKEKKKKFRDCMELLLAVGFIDLYLCGSCLKGKKARTEGKKSIKIGRDRTSHNEEVNGAVCGTL